jgi:hypothetical protein
VTAEAHDASRVRTPGISERLTHASHRYLLPAVGAGAATLGGVLFLGAGEPARPYLPFALVGLGAAAVVSSVAFHHWQYRRAAARAARAEIDPPPAVGTAVYAHSPSVPHSGIGRATTSPFAEAGERMWRQWETPAVRGLGAEVTGPVGEIPYVPSAIGPQGPYASRDVDLVILPERPHARSTPFRGPVGIPGAPRRIPTASVRAYTNSRMRLASRRRRPYSPAELDAMFPPDLSPAPSVPALPLATAELSPIPFARASLAIEPEAIAPARPLSAPPSFGAAGTAGLGLVEPPVGPDQPTGRFRILPSLLSLRDPLYVEMIQPIPPHLRVPFRPAARSDARATSTLPRPGSRSTECIGCLRPLSGFRGWVICPGCHGALCRRCLGASFLASAEGQCSRCRPWHARSAN